MAIRPVVLVYQDLATPTVTPSSPDLNCLIVGPAYHIQDYFAPGTTDYADKTSIAVSTDYGALEGSPDAALPVGQAAVEQESRQPDHAVGGLGGRQLLDVDARDPPGLGQPQQLPHDEPVVLDELRQRHAEIAPRTSIT